MFTPHVFVYASNPHFVVYVSMQTPPLHFTPIALSPDELIYPTFSQYISDFRLVLCFWRNEGIMLDMTIQNPIVR